MNAGEHWISEAFTPGDVWQHLVTKVFVQKQTEFQELMVVDSPVYGRALVLDQRWQTCTGDEFLYHEPIVHSPLIMHGNPRRVLIAGGADGGAIREALKWNSVETVVLVDIDGEAVEACRQHLPEIHQHAFDDPRVRVEIADAFDFVQNARDFDVIIADLTDPIESGPAYKLFTREFFLGCKRALAPGGYFINQAGSMSPPLAGPLARVAKTIASVFAEICVVCANVPTYGSQWGFVLASDVSIDDRPVPETIDAKLSEAVDGALRMFDGRAFLGLLQSPKYIRDMIERESTVYTLANPPQMVR